MSMQTLERDRPVREPDDPRRAAAARRVLSRWALRLAVREWKQRILIVLLITVATAATLLGIAVASATAGDAELRDLRHRADARPAAGEHPATCPASSRRSRRPTARRA